MYSSVLHFLIMFYSFVSVFFIFVLDYTKLFEYLQSLKGPIDMQMRIINDVIEESLRFKRKNLATLLQDFAEKIVIRKENVRPMVMKNGHR